MRHTALRHSQSLYLVAQYLHKTAIAYESGFHPTWARQFITLKPYFIILNEISLVYIVHKLLLRHVHVVSHRIKSVLNEVCEAESFQSIFAWFQFINMWFKFRPPIIDFSRDDRGDRNADMCFCSTGLAVSSSSCLSAMDFPCQLSIFNVGTTPNLWFISMQTREKLS